MGGGLNCASKVFWILSSICNFDMGGKYLLERMELPIFSQTLKDIAVATKRSPLNKTLQSTLKIGFALPVWGEGKNSPTKEAKQFVEDLFN